MKTFIFITESGEAYDNNGAEQANCQYLAIGKGETAAEAWEDCKNEIAGIYEDISAFELVSNKTIYGDFEL